MLDDLNELRTFQRILACGSLSAAARDLGVGLAVVASASHHLSDARGSGWSSHHAQTLTYKRRACTAASCRSHAGRIGGRPETRMASGWREPHGLLRVSAPVSFGRIHLITAGRAAD